MKISTRFPRHRRVQAPRRAKLLAAFDRSGLSAAAFARQHGLTYTTFCGWRGRQAKSKTPAGAKATAGRSPAFVQVEVTAPVAPELLIELGGSARLRLTSASQLDLAAALLQRLAPTQPC
jgi:hypothetical protein